MRSVVDVGTRPIDLFPIKDDPVREKAFELAWTLLRPELNDFTAAEVRSIRSFLARSILEAADEGETRYSSLSVIALRKLCSRLRCDLSDRFDAVS